jgi:hypothetical protein
MRCIAPACMCTTSQCPAQCKPVLTRTSTAAATDAKGPASQLKRTSTRTVLCFQLHFAGDKPQPVAQQILQCTVAATALRPCTRCLTSCSLPDVAHHCLHNDCWDAQLQQQHYTHVTSANTVPCKLELVHTEWWHAQLPQQHWWMVACQGLLQFSTPLPAAAQQPTHSRATVKP